MNKIEEKIELVTKDIQKRFGNECHYTIRILLWDDDTYLVECRHGTSERLHISKFYNGNLEYEEYDIKFKKGMMIDEKGVEYFPRENLNKYEQDI